MVDEKYEKKEQEYKKKLTEFFRSRLEFTYYEIYKKSNGKCKQNSILRIVQSPNFLDSVKNCIMEQKIGLEDLAKYGKEMVELSFEAILYNNKDYQQLYEKDEIADILDVCKFALGQIKYFD